MLPPAKVCYVLKLELVKLDPALTLWLNGQFEERSYERLKSYLPSITPERCKRLDKSWSLLNQDGEKRKQSASALAHPQSQREDIFISISPFTM